jgi:serine/threonine protein kinase
MGHYFTQEQKTLEVIRTIDNPHLIKPIAAFKLHNEENGSFLFPWAEGGNMRDFWSTETLRPHNSPDMMEWVVTQMSGLCHALSILHAGGHRHGDLKPENILLFHEGGYKGTLRIADLGLAKFHEAPTQQRKDLMRITNANTGTMLYVSPEFFHAEQIPRVFDVWSLGCIYVEFLVWILYGNSQLVQFKKTRFDHFWEASGKNEFLVHSNVRPLLGRLSEDLKAPQTALGDVLQVVKSQMLVPDSERRSKSHDVYESLAKILARAVQEPEYLVNPVIWSRISTRSQPFTTSLGQNLAPSSASLRRLPPLQDPQNSQLTHVNQEAPEIRVEDIDDHDSSGALTVPTTAKIARDVSLNLQPLTFFFGPY